MREFNPEMLILARESRGLSQSELADAVAVKQGTISKIESNLLVPSPELLAQLSEKLDYPEALFFQPDRLYGFNSTVFFHRKRQSLSDRTLRKLHAQMNLIRMRLERMLRSAEVVSDCKFQRIDPLEYNSHVGAIAKLVRSTWQIPAGPVRSVTRAIENAGGVVVATDFETRQADAISEWIPPSPPIFLINSNSDITGDRLRLTLAHEIGHIIMHRFPNPKMEEQASQFAAEFMAPAREVKPSLYSLSFAKLMDLKSQWKISMAALIQRAADLKTISENQRKYYFMTLSRRGWRMREPIETDIPVEAPELFDELISAHLTHLGYSPEQMATSVMLLKEREFRERYLEKTKLRLVG